MKMEDEKEIENDQQRAEVFDALGHPTRIAILKALSEGAFGFADLKKKTAIDSSGHLQHHLNKLDGLIKTDEYGKYCLSDQGKDALLTVQTVENLSSQRGRNPEKYSRRFNAKVGLKSVALLLAVLLIASTAIAVFEYNQASSLRGEITRSNEVNFEAMAYYNEFGVIPASNVNSSFTPPVSMYRALQMALQAGGWNKTSLNGMRVGAYLKHWKTSTNPIAFNYSEPIVINIAEAFYGIFDQVTTPPSDYSPVYGSDAVYRYVWQIVVDNSTVIEMPPPGFALIDAATGQMLPNPPLY
jgi:DNA-binding HxlR family transcriptional regulator